MAKLFLTFILPFLTIPLVSAEEMDIALFRPKMEARVYFKTADELFNKLGELFSSLDIASAGETDKELYIEILTDSLQLQKIKEKNLKVEITWLNIKDKFRAMTGLDPDRPELLRDFGFFFTYWEMIDTIQRLANNFPNLVRIYDIGRSHQNRPLWCVKISDYPDFNEQEPVVFFNAATHGREPLGVSILIYFMSHLLTNYDPANADNLITWLIDNREIYFVPVMNPDGYVYNSDSGGATANWRKNRRIIQSPSVGVDLNRNYGFKWAYDNVGSSPSPGSETYRGPSRFSEPETQVARDFMLGKKIRAQIDYHTYGRMNIYPWGYDTFTPPDVRTLREIIDTFRFYNRYGTNGQISKVLYKANGNSVDWEYADTLWEGIRKFVTYALVIEASITDFWYGWNDSAFIRQECERNLGVNTYLTKVSGAFLELQSVKIDDFYGNQDQQLNAGESAYVWFKVKNRAIHPIDSAYNITIRPYSEHPQFLILDTIVSFPRILRNDSAENQATPMKVYALPQIPPNTNVPVRLDFSYLDDEHLIRQTLRATINIAPISHIIETNSKIARLKVEFKQNRGELIIKLPFAEKPVRFSLHLVNGQLYKEGVFEKETKVSLKPGVYFLTLDKKDKVKIVIRP